MWPNPQFAADFVTFTEEILNGKHNFLCSTTFASPTLTPEKMDLFNTNIIPIRSNSWIGFTISKFHYAIQ